MWYLGFGVSVPMCWRDGWVILFIKLKINNKHEVFITDDVIINLQDFACLHVYICLMIHIRST